MKIWIVSSLDEEIIQGVETIQGRKLYEEIRYVFYFLEDMARMYLQLPLRQWGASNV